MHRFHEIYNHDILMWIFKNVTQFLEVVKLWFWLQTKRSGKTRSMLRRFEQKKSLIFYFKSRFPHRQLRCCMQNILFNLLEHCIYYKRSKYMQRLKQIFFVAIRWNSKNFYFFTFVLLISEVIEIEAYIKMIELQSWHKVL